MCCVCVCVCVLCLWVCVLCVCMVCVCVCVCKYVCGCGCLSVMHLVLLRVCCGIVVYYVSIVSAGFFGCQYGQMVK